MTNPEIKVGQKWRVVDAEEFNLGLMPRLFTDECLVDNSDLLTVVCKESRGFICSVYREDYTETLLDESDVEAGYVQLVEDVQESTEAPVAVAEVPATNVSEEGESVSQERTEASTDIQSGLSSELLWKFIEGSSEYNQHKQFEVDELSWDVLKDAVKTLGEYLENDEDTIATSLEIRLMYNGNLPEKFKHTWGASVYQVDYWKAGEHKDGHRDRLLFGVEIVRGI